ncbi:MAG: carboxypeptidase regulatory-like domain-containing protein [Acidimicrobiales bacterium]|nr:carboxypeptidase regulatory-like domain-containing protein [Acidimicrobiales bacterium]MDG2218129.1 carboxypeptidase regulatory-like domain-containing protein [Acidimicrobiales bacterium]
MLSRTTTDRVEVQPGAKGTIELEVTNLRDVIDGISPRVRDLDPSCYSLPVPYISIFPDATEKIRINIELPRSFAAGEHEIVVELRSTVDGGAEVDHPITLVVEPLDDIGIKLSPRAATAGSKTDFEVELINKGNTTLDLVIDAADAERVLKVETDPIFLRVPNGRTATSRVTAKGRRPFMGSPVRQTITVTAENSDHQLNETFQFIQKARLPTGLGTVMILAAIIALWALVFVWAISNVFDSDNTAKTAGEGFATSGPASLDIAGVNGSITGTIINVAGEGIPRLTVSATRIGGDDSAIASVATDDNGAFSIPVLPGSYNVQVGGEGYATTDFNSKAINVDPSTSTPPRELVLTGRRGTIRGRIIAENQDGAAPPAFSVLVRPVVGDVAGEPITANVVVKEDGSYIITGLATPAVYSLSLMADGFSPQSIIAELAGGADVIVNTRRLGAGSGAIRGRVFAGSIPIGAVAVTLVAGDLVMETTTPTVGSDVGVYAFEGLESPNTYLLTFTLEGFSTETVALEVEPGKPLEADDLELLRGTGEVAGTVYDAFGNPLGGVTVNVVGAKGSGEAQTLTADAIGSFRITGLPTPGNYSVTFSLAGYSPASRLLRLGDRSSAAAFDMNLSLSTATISGTASINGTDTAGVTITLSDGETPRTTESVSSPDAGAYTFPDVQPGTYTLTFETPGAKYVLLVNVGSGAIVDNANANLVVEG